MHPDIVRRLAAIEMRGIINRPTVRAAAARRRA